MLSRGIVVPLVSLAVVASACQRRQASSEAGQPRPPATRRAPVTDTYHGVPIADDYRWLETGRPRRSRVGDAPNGYARSVLDRLPSVDAIRETSRQSGRSPFALR
jgi:hypothetical protein